MSNRRDFLKKAGGLALLTIVPHLFDVVSFSLHKAIF